MHVGGGRRWLVPVLMLSVLVLVICSVSVGVSNVSPFDLLAGRTDARAMQVLTVSRIPRTLALVLSGSALAVAGLVMQLICQNRFVEPSTAGTVESTGLGLLIAMVLWPGAPPLGRVLVGAACAVAGTGLFILLLGRLPWRSPIATPLLGLMLGAVIGAMATLVAGRVGLGESLAAWRMGDFSGVLRGRYELFWATAVLAGAAYLAADRLTAAALGEAFTTNLGLGHRRIMATGVVIVALTTAVVVATVGALPFLGLVVPNMVTRLLGDGARAAIPATALAGGALILACDILGRLVRHPYEVPVGIVVGMVGGSGFLLMLLQPRGALRGG